ASLRGEAAALSALCQALGVVPTKPIEGGAKDWRGLASGERACYAYELYRHVVPDSSVTLEQLLALIGALAKADGNRLQGCLDCDAAILVDLLGMQRRLCAHCRNERARRSNHPMSVDAPGEALSTQEGGNPWSQGDLF